MSGLALSEDGTVLTSVSDKGGWARAQLDRDREGRLKGVRTLASGRLKDAGGAALSGRNIDAEGLALAHDGTFFISFEAHHRVAAYADIAGPSRPLPVPREFTALQNNSGLEALFLGPAGRPHAIPERSGRLARPFPLYRLDEGTRWRLAGEVPRRPPHLVVGADFGPDGRLYVLERDFAGLRGFSTRIRRFRLSARGLDREEILLETPHGRHGNLEGIDVWRGADGRIRATAIADDNESIFQRTEIVEYVLEGATVAVRPRPRPAF